MVAQGRSQAPLRQRAPKPHSLLNWQAGWSAAAAGRRRKCSTRVGLQSVFTRHARAGPRRFRWCRAFRWCRRRARRARGAGRAAPPRGAPAAPVPAGAVVPAAPPVVPAAARCRPSPAARRGPPSAGADRSTRAAARRAARAAAVPPRHPCRRIRPCPEFDPPPVSEPCRAAVRGRCPSRRRIRDLRDACRSGRRVDDAASDGREADERAAGGERAKATTRRCGPASFGAYSFPAVALSQITRHSWSRRDRTTRALRDAHELRTSPLRRSLILVTARTRTERRCPPFTRRLCRDRLRPRPRRSSRRRRDFRRRRRDPAGAVTPSPLQRRNARYSRRVRGPCGRGPRGKAAGSARARARDRDVVLRDLARARRGVDAVDRRGVQPEDLALHLGGERRIAVHRLHRIRDLERAERLDLRLRAAVVVASRSPTGSDRARGT